MKIHLAVGLAFIYPFTSIGRKARRNHQRLRAFRWIITLMSSHPYTPVNTGPFVPICPSPIVHGKKYMSSELPSGLMMCLFPQASSHQRILLSLAFFFQRSSGSSTTPSFKLLPLLSLLFATCRALYVQVDLTIEEPFDRFIGHDVGVSVSVTTPLGDLITIQRHTLGTLNSIYEATNNTAKEEPVFSLHARLDFMC